MQHGMERETQDVISLLKGKHIEELSYIRYVTSDEATGYAVCLSDGTQLAVFPNRDAAYYTAQQYELNPQSVH